MLNNENAILSEQWRPINFRIQSVINEIINCIVFISTLNGHTRPMIKKTTTNKQSFQNCC